MSKSADSNDKTAVNMGSPAEEVKKIKQGHSFLGCLCDMRRAVIMLNILGFGLGLAGLIAIILVDKYGSKEDTNWLFNSTYDFWFLLLVQVAAIVAHVCGIMGAIGFSVGLVLIEAMVQIFYGVLSGLDHNWFGLAFSVLVFYPMSYCVMSFLRVS